MSFINRVNVDGTLYDIMDSTRCDINITLPSANWGGEVLRTHRE